MHVLSAQDFAYRSNRCFQFCQPSLCSCLPCYHQQRQIEAEDIVLFPIPLKPITNHFGFYPRQQKFTYGAFLSYATSVNHYSGSLTCSMPPFFFAVWSNFYTLFNWMNVVVTSLTTIRYRPANSGSPFSYKFIINSAWIVTMSPSVLLTYI